jgi:hypothetical protein
MPQDHFLNKVYESLLSNKQSKIKSSFHTLSESYDLVYEEDQQPVTEPVKTSTPTSSWLEEFVNTPILDTKKWSDEQLNLYKLTDTVEPETEFEGETETGVGPGEYAVASLLTGLTQFPDPRLENMISGQMESYDVSWPSKDSAKYTFEVKKIESKGDVRLGRKGADIGKTFTNTVDAILQNIREEYNILNDNDKNKINEIIISKLDKIEEPKRKEWRGVETKDYKKYAKRMAKRTGWTVEGFIEAIQDNMSELSFDLIFGKGETRDYEYPASGKSELRQQAVIMSLVKLVTICETVSKKDFDQDEGTESEEAVKDLFHQVYDANDITPTFKDYLDKEARNVDKRITKQKIRVTKTEGAYELFFDNIKELKISKKLEELQQIVTSKKTIEELFPDTITGLFVVNINGYQYIPQKYISTYVYISRITQSKPKIKIRKNADV